MKVGFYAPSISKRSIPAEDIKKFADYDLLILETNCYPCMNQLEGLKKQHGFHFDIVGLFMNNNLMDKIRKHYNCLDCTEQQIEQYVINNYEQIISLNKK